MAKPKITVKEAKLIRGIAEGKTPRQAALETYNVSTPESASALASKTLTKVNVQEALGIALNKYNITPDRTLKRVSEALDAEKVTIVGNGDDSMAEITPDHTIRLSAVKIAHNLMGVGQNKEVGDTNVFIGNQFNAKEFVD